MLFQTVPSSDTNACIFWDKQNPSFGVEPSDPGEYFVLRRQEFGNETSANSPTL